MSLEKIFIKLEKLEKDIQEIKEGIKRADDHHTFITRMYFVIKPKIMEFINNFNSVFNQKSFNQKQIQLQNEALFLKNKEEMEDLV